MISTIHPLAKKLGLRPEMRAWVVNPPVGYRERLGLPPDGAKGPYLFIQIFVTSLAELERSVPKLLRRAAPNALVWIAYPKKTSRVPSDLSRDVIAAAVGRMGWHPVAIVALDAVWSALRFRPDAQA